jgi:hypothetical protein
MKKSAIKTGEGRIIVLSSTAHTMSKGINFENMFLENGAYGKWVSYSQSKLANILFAQELNERLKNDNIPITVNSLHPGVINTELGRDFGKFAKALMYTIGYFFMKSIPQGAATTVYCTVSGDLKGVGGKYFSDCNLAVPIEYCKNVDYQKKFWDVSEKILDMKYSDQMNDEKEDNNLKEEENKLEKENNLKEEEILENKNLKEEKEENNNLKEEEKEEKLENKEKVEKEEENNLEIINE